jgi:cytochrome c peroxidase
MLRRPILQFAIIPAGLVVLFHFTILRATDPATELTKKEFLGKKLFFETISAPANQSCEACHGEGVGGTGPDLAINQHGSVYQGAVQERFGNRKPPSSSYATVSPKFSYNVKEKHFEGGNFWDGRATGWELGNPAADQAQGPFLNPVEQNMPDEKSVCEQVASSDFAGLFEEVWGKGSLNCQPSKVSQTYDKIALSIAAFEGSASVNQFSSKYDAWRRGKTKLTATESKGLELFKGKAKCASCHVMNEKGSDVENLFTDFTYDNLGMPRNPENPFYKMNKVMLSDGKPINLEGKAWVDQGLGEFLRSLADPNNQAWRKLPYVTNVKDFDNEKLLELAKQNDGKQRVPTVRNVDKRPDETFVKAYSHNGYFKSLWSIVHFYNTRDTKPVCADPFTTEKDALSQGCWPQPEVRQNVNRDELGNLGLTHEEEMYLVEFLKILSDGWNPNQKGMHGNRLMRSLMKSLRH